MGLTRLDVDAWALYSQRERDPRPSIQGAFADEIVPMTVTRPDGEKVEFSVDEFPRRGVTVESLSKLPVLRPEMPNPTVTAGNSAGINDARRSCDARE